jgi:hypothetical protein
MLPAPNQKIIQGMILRVLITCASFFAFDKKLIAQANIEGLWKGSSICQVKESPCHDEQVVYHILQDSNKLFQVTMNKIINGKEDYMGTMPFHLDSLTGAFISRDQERNALWEFKISKNEMSGNYFIEISSTDHRNKKED